MGDFTDTIPSRDAIYLGLRWQPSFNTTIITIVVLSIFNPPPLKREFEYYRYVYYEELSKQPVEIQIYFNYLPRLTL